MFLPMEAIVAKKSKSDRESEKQAAEERACVLRLADDRMLEILNGGLRSISYAEVLDLLEGGFKLDGEQKYGFPFPEGREKFQRWLERGDGIAVYRCELMDHSEFGHLRYYSFGSPEAQIPGDTPAKRCPVGRGSVVDSAYFLVAVHRPAKPVDFPLEAQAC